MKEKLTQDSVNYPKGKGESFLIRAGASHGEDDAIVWDTFRSGNRKAFDYIFHRHIRLLYTYGSRISVDQGLVEDCIQDLFIDLWNKRESLGNTDNVKFYLLTSLRRRKVRRLASDKRLHFDEALHDDYTAEMEFSVEFDIIREQISLEQRRISPAHCRSFLSGNVKQST